MLEFESKVKKWGNSFGVIIPKEIIKRESLKEDEEIHIIAIKKNKAVAETFGMFKDWKMTGQKAKDIARKELYHDRTSRTAK